MSTLRSTRVGLPLLVERHHDDRGAVALDLRAPARRKSLLALLEADRVDDALPLQALEAGLEHDQRELSTMIGMRATSGSVATQVEEGRHRLLRSRAGRRPCSTSRMFAPPRTCSSATSTGLLEVARLDQPPEARRAGDVRSLADHDEVRRRGRSGTAPAR